ncbi:MAG: histidinol-phosphate transaminase [Gammaproteobacteria bacterium]|nr:MAG: histidinol-phosphate transaminase [Pseudomonadota bacterium]PIE38959.1 MAG: histidinol-phosphate transaminase [Gammaproteobacteria bacterium]
MSCDFLALANAGVQRISPYVPGKPEDELQRELGLERVVKLASNENPLGPSQKVIEAVSAKPGAISRYPDGNGFELKQALTSYLGIEENQVTLGNGSNDVLELVARAYSGPGDEVVFSEHAFAVYPLATLSAGATPVAARADNWAHDLDRIAACLSEKTRLIFLANPNNPTGTWFHKDELEAFLNRVPEHIVVVLDEAYFEYVSESGYPDGISLLKKHDNLIVTRTFSKAWGLASLRVGFAVSSPAIADVLNRVRQPFNVNTMAQVAAVAVLGDAAYLQKSVETNDAGLRQLESGFSALGLDYIPSVGNFIAVDVGARAGEVYQSLLQQGVIVRPVANYQMPRHLRVSVGLKEENSIMLEALEKSLKTGA